MVELWRCEICGDPYIGDEAPANCPFCGAKKEFIKLYGDAQVNYDVVLSEKDKVNVTHALEVEISNSAFYFCAAEKVLAPEGKKLFKALGKVEAEHAAIWKKILKLDTIEKGKDVCFEDFIDDLKESHARETRAIDFYRKAADESDNPRVKQLFEALVEIETDHLMLSKQKMRACIT